MGALRGARRLRRGSELIEFAMVFPVFMFLFFGVMEFSWYFFQRGAVTEAARLGCQAAGHLDPLADDDGAAGPDFATVAQDVIVAELGRQAGILCGVDGYVCDVEIVDLSDPANDVPRVTCGVSVNYISLTGFLVSDTNQISAGTKLAETRWGTGTEGRMLPQFITGRATSVFEGAL